MAGRPFVSVDEMNSIIINNHNQMVGPEDDLYILGDVCMGQRSQMPDLIRRLQGKLHLVAGNHDEGLLKNPDNHSLFASVDKLLEIEVPGDGKGHQRQMIVMCHFALESWHRNHKGSWMLHGHSHGTLNSPDTMLRLDVGVDMTAKRLGYTADSYRPLTFEEIRRYMSTKKFEPVDHHGAS